MGLLPRRTGHRKRKDELWKPKKHHVRGRELRKLLREGTIPLDLIRVDLFLAVLTVALRGGKSEFEHGTPEYGADVARKYACVAVALDMLVAFQSLSEHGDGSPWQAAVSKAKALGF
jgi:hypothetical protein